MTIERVPPEIVRPLRHLVLRPGRPLESSIMPGDDKAIHLALRDGGEPLAVASLYVESLPDGPQPGDWRLRGMAVHPDFQGRGLGGKILDAAAYVAADEGGRRLWCNARTTAAGFYLRHGFVTIGDEFDIEHIGPHLRMWRVIHVNTSSVAGVK
jgi:GNAT superfamily N-acetyltransferase